jgi:hypothetical protein
MTDSTPRWPTLLDITPPAARGEVGLRSNPGDATAILSLAETPPHSDPLPRTRGEGAELFFPCRFVARLTRSHLCAQPDRRLFDRSFATAGAATPCWQQAVDMTACCHERLEAIRAYRSGAGGLPPQWPHHRLRRRAGRQDRPDQRTAGRFWAPSRCRRDLLPLSALPTPWD